MLVLIFHLCAQTKPDNNLRKENLRCYQARTHTSLLSIVDILKIIQPSPPPVMCQWRSNTDLERKRAVWKMSRGESRGLVWCCIAGAKRWAIYKSSCGQKRAKEGGRRVKRKKRGLYFLELFILYIVGVFVISTFLGYFNTETLRNSVFSRKWSKNCEETMSRHYNDLRGAIPGWFGTNCSFFSIQQNFAFIRQRGR